MSCWAVSWSVSGRLLCRGESRRGSGDLEAMPLCLLLEIKMLCGRRQRTGRRNLLFSSPHFFRERDEWERSPSQIGPPCLWLFRPEEVISAFKLHLGFFTDKKTEEGKIFTVVSVYFANSKRKISLCKPVYNENRGAQTSLHYHNLFHITNEHCNSCIF